MSQVLVSSHSKYWVFDPEEHPVIELADVPLAMPFSVQPVAVTDADTLASVMTSSHWQDAHWKALFEDFTTPEQVTLECAQRLPWNLVNGRAVKRHQKAIDIESGEVVGYARWILPPGLPEAKTTAWIEAQVTDVSPDRRQQFEVSFVDATDNKQIRHLRRDLVTYRSTLLEEVDEKFMEDGPYLCTLDRYHNWQRKANPVGTTALDYLSTTLTYQRQGVAALLLESGLKVADANGLRTYVTASPARLKLYQSHDFELVQTVSVVYSQYGGTENTDYPFMVRQVVRSE